jgi:hypothetical protein
MKHKTLQSYLRQFTKEPGPRGDLARAFPQEPRQVRFPAKVAAFVQEHPHFRSAIYEAIEQWKASEAQKKLTTTMVKESIPAQESGRCTQGFQVSPCLVKIDCGTETDHFSE